jgi:hypothetical protein
MPEKPQIQINQKPEWYVMGADGVNYGPFEITQISDYIKQERITSETRVQHPKHTNGVWNNAANVPVLSHLFRTASPTHQKIDLSQVKAKAAQKSDTDGGLVDIFDVSFQRFATPLVVKILWVIFLALWCLETVLFLPFYTSVSLRYTGQSLFEQPDQRIQSIVAIMIFVVFYTAYKLLSLLVVRLICEGIIVIFDIRNQLILLRETQR